MPQFLFGYHGGKTPESEEEGKQQMAAWMAWFEEMGEAVAIPGNPVGMSKTVSATGVADDGGANPMSGFTVVQANSIEAACAMAKGCPMVSDGSGSVEVAEVIELEM
ncbi:MAG: YciI family protein [Leisingera sp.]